MPDNTLLFGIILVALVAFVMLSAASGRDSDLPVEPKRLMTARELEAFRHLRSLFPNYHVAPQVAMGAIIQTRSGLGSSLRTKIRNEFDRKIVDFVVVEPETGKIAFLIEIDDSSHRADKDSRRDAITKAAGYRTIRHRAGAKVDRASLQATIRQALEPVA